MESKEILNKYSPEAMKAAVAAKLADKSDKKEEIQIVLKRIIEKPIIKLYLMHHKMKDSKHN